MKSLGGSHLKTLENSYNLVNIRFISEERSVDYFIFHYKIVGNPLLHYFFGVALCTSAWIEITHRFETDPLQHVLL